MLKGIQFSRVDKKVNVSVNLFSFCIWAQFQIVNYKLIGKSHSRYFLFTEDMLILKN